MGEILNSKKIKWALIVFIIIYLIPFFYSISLSIPQADDFSFANKIDKTNILLSSIEQTKWMYYNWQGNWFYVFLMCAINPLVLFGLDYTAYGLEMIILTLLFFISLLLLVINFTKYYLKKEIDNLTIFIYFIFIIIITNLKIYYEIYYWFDGSNYMWAMTFASITASQLFKLFSKKSSITLVLCCLIGFLSATCYQLAPFVGIIWLMLFIQNISKYKKIDIKLLLPIVFMLAGGIIAVVSPGNFIRKGSEISPIITLVFAGVDVIRVLTSVYTNPIIVVSFLLFVAIGMLTLKEKSKSFKYPLIPVIIHLFCLYVMCYPAALAYGGTSISYPNRMSFIMDSVSMLYIATIGLYFGGWLSCYFDIKATKKNLIIMISVLVLFSYVSIVATDKYENEAYYYTINNILKIKENSDIGREILKNIKNSNSDRIVINIKKNNETKYLDFSKPISNNNNDWINRAVAEFFGKSSVVLK